MASSKRTSPGLSQVAALPWRLDKNGRCQVMLLTSRETRRWIIPKGWPKKALSPSEVARLEAFEEAGLIGRITPREPIGRYLYEKKLPNKRVLCAVDVYSLRVERQLDEWPEKSERETRWFDAEVAVALVSERDLADIIRLFAEPHASAISFRSWRKSRPAKTPPEMPFTFGSYKVRHAKLSKTSAKTIAPIGSGMK